MNTLDQYRTLFNQALEQWTPPDHPRTLYEPVRYILDLGGKRLRPVLVLMAAEISGGRAEDAMGPAMAIEWFHNFSLLHDDIMDQAALRRGKPTVHEFFSPNAAILSGDVMLVDAFRFISQVQPALFPELLDRFSRMAVEVCQGQQLDMDFEQRLNVTRSEYLEMIRLKTAVLLGCSLYCGARTGGATVEQAESLYKFGEQLGLAFQLRDDLLDTYGDPDKFGKHVGGDILQDKKTYLLIHALETATPEDHRMLMSWVGRGGEGPAATPTGTTATDPGQSKPAQPASQAKIAAVRAVFDRSRTRQAAESAIHDHHTRALEALALAGLSSANENVLRDLAEEMLVREQ